MQSGAEQMKQSAKAVDRGKHLVSAAASLGEIVAILMRSPEHAGITLGALEGMLIPALVNRQFLVIRARVRGDVTLLPVAVITWAELSDELFDRCAANPGAPLELTREQRKSGPNIWITDVAGDALLCNKALNRLRKVAFAGKRLGLARQDSTGVWSSIVHPAH